MAIYKNTYKYLITYINSSCQNCLKSKTILLVVLSRWLKFWTRANDDVRGFSRRRTRGTRENEELEERKRKNEIGGRKGRPMEWNSAIS